MGAPQERAYFRYNRVGKPYLVRRVTVAGKRKEQWIPLDKVDHEALEAALKIKSEIQDEIVWVPCTNPRCSGKVPMTKKQLEEFYISSKKRYNIVIFPFCKPECRDVVLAEHGGTVDGSDKS